eukprot:15336709-Ditylum_brightwellii.AAC.1
MLVNFANGSHANSSFQLLHWCGRHALDTKSHDLAKTTAILFCFDDRDSSVGIALINEVPASMNNVSK